jgi:hypothetical protein
VLPAIIKNQGVRHIKRWKYSEDDVRYVAEHYATMSAREISEKIGCSQTWVVATAKELGVRKSSEWIAERAKVVTMRLTHGSKATRFKPGNRPMNKGRKQEEYMTPEQIAKTAATRFKKGNRPVGWRPVGSERTNVEGYREIKMREGLRGWDPKHKVVWEAYNGEVPKGYCVSFLNGDKQDCRIQNLCLKTKRELLMENSLANYPEEVRDIIHWRAVLKREINKQKRNEQ